MNIWLVGAAVMTVALVPAVITTLRGRSTDRVVGLELVGILMAQMLFLYAVGTRRVPFVDIGLGVAVLAFGAGRVFARFLERWL